jgi:TPR repeat protein
MYALGYWHAHGMMGLTVDAAKGYKWHMTAAMTANAKGTHGGTEAQVKSLSRMGSCLVHGSGVEQNEAHGTVVVLAAASLGSNLAASALGDWYSQGLHGMPRDIEKAKEWYAKVATSKYQHMSREWTERAAALLRELSS